MNALRNVWRSLVARRPVFSDPATGWIVLLTIFAGSVLRIQRVGYPFFFGFDEEQMVTAARQFLEGVPDTGECCHPPLSKVMISASILMLGDNPMAWRFPSLLLGLQSIVLVYLIGKSLFNDSRAGWLAAAFLAADGFAIAFSRDAFPEGMMTCFVLWSMLAAITARGWAGVVTCAILVGLAGSIKWSGIQVGLPACVAILLLRRVPWYSIFAFALVPLVHLVVWMMGLSLIGHDSDPMSVVEEIRLRQSRHLGFVRFANPLESVWYTWFYIYKPIVLKAASEAGRVRLASSVSNVLLFFTSNLCLAGLPILGAAYAFSDRVRQRFAAWFDEGQGKALLILGVSWLSMMLLWFTGRISSYWYHYLTPYGFAVLLTAGVVSRLDRRHGKVVLGFVALLLLVFVYFAPVWGELPISVQGAHRRLIFKRWQ